MSCAASLSCSAAIPFFCPGWRTRSHSSRLRPRSAGFLCSQRPQRPVAGRSHGVASRYPGPPSRCMPSISSCALALFSLSFYPAGKRTQHVHRSF